VPGLPATGDDDATDQLHRGWVALRGRGVPLGSFGEDDDQVGRGTFVGGGAAGRAAAVAQPGQLLGLRRRVADQVVPHDRHRAVDQTAAAPNRVSTARWVILLAVQAPTGAHRSREVAGAAHGV